MSAIDNVEIVEPFLPYDAVYDLSPVSISLTDHHFYFVGRYLAQLHCSGMLMRDVSVNNIMFRLSDGYPVLIDEPIPNYWGDKAGVFCRDLFVPAISFPKARFEAFCLGYFENMQRLYAGESEDILEEIIHCMGGDFVSVPNFHNPIQIIGFLQSVLGDGDEADGVGLSRRHLVWSLMILQLYGLSAESLDRALKRLPETEVLARTALDFSDRTFLRFGDDAEWVPEVLLLRRYSELCRERETLPGDNPTFLSNAALTSYMELFGDQPADSWADEFVTFWVQFLSGLSAFFDQRDRMLSIHATQIAHVVLQYVNLAALQKYKILHFLRCSDARRSWYWLAMDENMEDFVHCAAHRNTECITITRVLKEFDPENSPPGNMPIHLIFDLLEYDRNLLGNMIIFWSKPGIREKESGPSALIPRIAPGIIRRIHRTAIGLIRLFADKKDTCFHFGWRIRVPEEDEKDTSEDSDSKKNSEDPVGLRELAWTHRLVTRMDDGEKFDFDTFADEFAWIGGMWGSGWHTPFDRLGEGGFRVVVTPKQDGKGNIVVRAGCGIVVFETIPDSNGRIQAQVMELLWPIPNEKGEGHFGEYAKA